MIRNRDPFFLTSSVSVDEKNNGDVQNEEVFEKIKTFPFVDAM